MRKIELVTTAPQGEYGIRSVYLLCDGVKVGHVGWINGPPYIGAGLTKDAETFREHGIEFVARVEESAQS